jgi:predicted Zn-dependent protease
MAIKRHPLEDAEERGHRGRKLTLAAAVLAAAALAGGGGYVYVHNHSAAAMARKGAQALAQHDTKRAVEYLSQAVRKTPLDKDAKADDLAVGARNLLTKALIEDGREEDARPYTQEVLQQAPENIEALENLAETYVHPAFRRYRTAIRPLSVATSKELFGVIDAGLAGLQKLPRTSRNVVAQAELQRLYHVIEDEGRRLAKASLEVATAAGDQTAIGRATSDLAVFADPEGAHQTKAKELLNEAWKLDPADPRAPKLLAQYAFQDHQYADAEAVYDAAVKAGGEKAVSQELAIVQANALMADTARQPDKDKRFADAQGVLEAYLKENPDDARVVVAVGQVMLERNNTAGASEMANRALGKPDADIDAQILLVNVLLREKKTAEALKLVTPLTSSRAGVPQVWYLLGLATADTGNYRAAGDAFRKAISLNGGYALAKRALLTNDIQDGNMAEAQQLATQMNQDDRYFIPAWAVTCENLREHGQVDQAQRMLTSLASDPELPPDARPDLVTLLVSMRATAAADALLKSLPPDDPSTLRLRAQNAVATGNFTMARGLLETAVKGDPKNVPMRLEYASLLANAGFNGDARAQLDEIVKGPVTPEEALRVARGYLTLRLPDQAQAVLKPVLAEQPAHAEAGNLQAQATAMKNGTPIAATGINPDQATPAETLHLAQQALDQKDATRALSLSLNGLAKDSSNWGLHLVAGRALGTLGKTDKAIDELVAAANAQPNSIECYSAFVALFPTPDAARSGLGFTGRLETINQAMADWTMGKLAETSGQDDLARKYYVAGLDASNRLTEPRQAKDALYTAIINLEASRKDAAALAKAADLYAGKDAFFAPGIRILAADQLMALGDRAAASAQLDRVTASLPKDAAPNVLMAVVQRRVGMGQADKARSLLEPRASADNADPRLIDAYASLLQESDPAAALKARQTLVKRDPQNPQYRVALAETMAQLGDAPGAMATLDEVQAMGETGRELATAARIRYLISMGLLKTAEQELASVKGAQDYASRLAVGRGWLELKKTDDARKALSSIPAYAAEYPAAQIALAAIDTEAGNTDASVKALTELSKTSPAAAQQASVPLFHTLIRAGKQSVAMELARSQREQLAPHSPEWRNWTLLAAMAAREGKDYDVAVQMLDTLDPETRAASALDVALLRLLQGKPADALAAGKTLNNDAPSYNQTFVAQQSGNDKGNARTLGDAMPSVVLSTLAAMPAPERAGQLAAIAKNPHVFAGDVQTLLNEVGSGDDSGPRLMKLALANRVLEAGWSTAALDLAAADAEGAKPLTAAMILKHQALTSLHRTADADKVRDALATQFKSNGDAAPTVRVLLAASWGKEGRYADALQVLQPLEQTGRSDILTTLATLQEKLGHLDQAVALHRRVRAADPNDVIAANNLAYTLVAAHPDDKATLAEARKHIEFAISKAPQVKVFQDTLAWIEILSGQAADGTARLAKALPAMRLDPAVHYHLGVGYAKIGQAALARMNLQNVAVLASDEKASATVPEVAMATEALKSLPQQ